jgi:hypothetical protein
MPQQYDITKPYGNTTFPASSTIKTNPSRYADTIFPSPTNALVTENDFRLLTNPAGSTYPSRYSIMQNRGNVANNATWITIGKNTLSGVASGIGNPLTQQFVQPLISAIPIPLQSTAYLSAADNENMGKPYIAMPIYRIDDIEKWTLSKYKDFRSFRYVGNVFDVDTVRLDGASAAARGAFNLDARGVANSIAYAAASALPGGAYTVFNIESIYGWGDQGNPNALRRDFSIRTNVATRWVIGPTPKDGKWAPTTNPLERATEFLGDKINVIDYSKRRLKSVYVWKPQWNAGNEKWDAFNNFISATDLTKDFIKFYFTGPKLNAGNTADKDDIIVFRATIDSLSDSHTPGWSTVNMIGRADPNYMYTGYSREVQMNFTVYATSRDEVKPIWRKLNALAGYTTPEYGVNTIAMKSPWMRMTVGDLFVQQPVIITSLSYTLADADTTWEINVEGDPTMMEVPHKVTVQMGFNVLTDWLPQKDGKFYSLAKTFDGKTGIPIEGGDNWLSDFGTNNEAVTLKRWLENTRQNRLKDKGVGESQPPGTTTN